MSRLTRDGTAEPISRDQILRHARGQGNIIFPVQLTTSRIGSLRSSFVGIGFGSGILLDLVLFADRIIAETKSNRSILWDMEVCNDLNGVCAFF